MRFEEFVYKRPDMDGFKEEFNEVLGKFEGAGSLPAADEAMTELNELRNRFDSMRVIAQIRHTIDTTDPVYKAEQDYFDEAHPVYQGLVTKYYQALLDSRHAEKLKDKWGAQLFRVAEIALKSFSQEVIADLQMENRLASSYRELIASARIRFAGEERNLPQLVPFQLSPDRQVRKDAHEAKYAFFGSKEEELSGIFDNLVKVRDTIARKLGLSNFVELGYLRLFRSDYDAAAVAGFRQQVLKYIVPVACELKVRQHKRIGVERFMYYDNKISFKTGDPRPMAGPDGIVEGAARMYAELSPETKEFFSFMQESGLMDLHSRKGKASGGYCDYIGIYKAPFIFGSFNGTSEDIDLLTHEAGHAFQAYQSRSFSPPEYLFPTYEAAEIHSMSMEFITWPWMELFFGEEADKYRFSHLAESLIFIPYAAAVDEFQHLVYTEPALTPAERKSAWRETERKYLPYLDYTGSRFLESGGFWMQQGHIFRDPFYYIDYALAQICSFQFWQRSQAKDPAGWRDYLSICRAGGSRPFTELLQVAGLASPFDAGCVSRVTAAVRGWLESVDDAKLDAAK